MKMSRTDLSVALALLVASPIAAQTSPGDFVGTWELASIESPNAAGVWEEAALPMTGSPVGIIMYDALGNMAVQITGSPRGVESPAGQPEIVNGYVAYYARYEVDSAAGTSLIGGPRVFPVTATYDALIASGRIELLESAALRRELARWSTAIADLREEEQEAFNQMDQRLLPFLWDYVPIVTLDLNVHPRYEGVDLNQSRFPRRYRELLRLIRFENAVEERMNSSIRAIESGTEVENVAERVLSLVESELR